MRRGRIFFIIALLMIIGLGAVLVIYLRVIVPAQQAAKVQPTATPVPVRIMVAAQRLTKGTVLTEEMLQAVPWPPDQIIPGMFVEVSKNEVLKRQLKYDVDALMPIMESFLIDEGEQIPLEGSPWALSIPPGQIAVSIPIGMLNAVSYAPRAGDHVDVIASILFLDIDTDFQSVLPNAVGLVIASGPPNPESGTQDPLTVMINPNLHGRTEIDPVLGQAVYIIPNGQQRARMVSHMVIQDAMVLGIGTFPLAEEKKPSPEETPQPTPTPEPGVEQPKRADPLVLTLIVRPQDAVTLNYLMFGGAQLTLALRSPNDSTRFPISPVTLQFLLDQYQIPVPVRLPYSLEPLIPQLYYIQAPTPQPGD